MKKILSILLALALMLGAAALAEGNVTIAVQGMNDFNDNIQSMIVYGDKLLLSSWDTLYTWDNTSRKLTPVEGYDKLQNVLTGDGETPGALELNDGEYAYLDGNLYAVGGKLYRMATISDEDGNSTNQLVELLIADDGALSLGEIIDLGDALCIVETYGDESYTYTRNLSNPCSFGSMLYALSYGEELELLALNLEDESVETLTVDVDGDVQNIAPYTEGKLLMTVVDYTTETPSTTLWLYDIENEEAAELGALPTNGYETPDGLAYDEARGKMYYVLAGSVWRVDVSEDGRGEPEEFGDMPLSYASGNGVVYGDLYVLASYDVVVGRDVTLDKLPAQRMRVANGDYVDSINKAYYAFTDKHPEYMISISTTLDTDSLLHDEPRFLRGYLHPPQHEQRVYLADEPRLYGRIGGQPDHFRRGERHVWLHQGLRDEGRPHLRAAALLLRQYDEPEHQAADRKAGLRGADLVEGAADDSGRYFKQQAARGDAGSDDRRTGLRQG